jgi:hypothetical protein
VPLPVIGLILGIVASVRAASNPSEYGGGGRAAVGIILSVLGLILFGASLMLGQQLLPSMRDGVLLGMVSGGLKEYANDHAGEFPPRASVLVDEKLVPTVNDIFNPGANPTSTSFHYVVGLRTSDPGNWIVAYKLSSAFGQPIYALSRVSGEVDGIRKEEFDRELEAMRSAYEKDRGQPMVVISPAAEAGLTTMPAAGAAAPATQPATP